MKEEEYFYRMCCFEKDRKCDQSCIAYGKVAKPDGNGYGFYCKRLGFEK